jgi:hypothetical protein
MILFTSSALDAQCAMCKAVVENGNVGMAEGVNSGITYLMVFPYILVALLLFFIYRHRKTAKN